MCTAKCKCTIFLKVSSGTEFTVALGTDGVLWSWGFNANGQLGLNSSNQVESTPQALDGEDWVDVEAGAFHCLALKSDGTLWSWGFNSFGQLGTNSTTNSDISILVNDDTDWIDVAGGGAYDRT